MKTKTKPNLKLPDWLYDLLKWLCLIVLPALGALYSQIAARWGWPYAEEIPGTLSDVGDFLGAILGLSSIGYAWGKLNQSGKESNENDGNSTS